MDIEAYYSICKADWEYRKKQVEDGEITMEDARFFHWMAIDDILWAMNDDEDDSE